MSKNDGLNAALSEDEAQWRDTKQEVSARYPQEAIVMIMNDLEDAAKRLILFEEARRLSSEGQLDEAINCYVKVIDLDTSLPRERVQYQEEPLNNIGTIKERQGKINEAIDFYRQAVAVAPDHAGLNFNLAHALGKQGKWQEEINGYRRAIELDPTVSKFYNNLAVVLQEQGWMQEAADVLRQAISINPESVSAYHNLAAHLSDMGHFDEAHAEYRRVLELKPELLQTHINLANSLMRAGKYEQAIAQWREVRTRQPDFPSLHAHLAFAYTQVGQTEDAIETYRLQTERTPHQARIWTNLGFALLEQAAKQKSKSVLPEARHCFRAAWMHKPFSRRVYVGMLLTWRLRLTSV